MKKLFVAMSHELTPDQVENFGGEIVTLKSVAPELQAQASNLDPKATKEQIEELAAKIVQQARKAEATHFCFMGEPSVAFWANLFAIGYKYELTGEKILGSQGKPSIIPIVATTERVSVETKNEDGSVTKTNVFKHVQWRELF